MSALFDAWGWRRNRTWLSRPEANPPPGQPLTVSVGERRLPLRLRRHPRARRLGLRLSGDGAGLIVTLPPDAPLAAALAFVDQNQRWIEERLAKLPPRVPFVEGAVIPLRGAPHRLRHRPGPKARIGAAEGWLDIEGGGPEFAARLTGWLKGEARRELTAAARHKAQRLGRPLGRVGVRDPRSRWGSCAANGNLSFSWRLILAPPTVLDYVAAHEVAHLLVPRHDATFWRVTADLTEDVEGARRWLRRHGPGLFGYGGEDAP